MSKLKSAFTLAEILITLAIVGIIASLTIPSLISNVGNSKETTQLRKTYSAWSQAFILVMGENGSIDSLFSSTGDTGSQAMNVFGAKLNIIKNCGSGTGCWYDTARYYYDGSVANAALDTSIAGDYGKAILADGSMIRIDNNQSNCLTNEGTGPLLNSVCGTVQIDVNGAKLPNTIGKDFFMFWVTKTGIYPLGSNGDGFSCGTGADWNTSLGCTSKSLAGS